VGPAISDMHAIHLQDISYRYPRQDSPTLEDIRLTVEPGEFVLLMGPTGGGKSTLSLCLNGIIPRMLGGDLKGSISVFGFSPKEKDVYEMATKIGLVFQDADSQICNIFVRDEVGFGAQNLLVPRELVLERIKRVLHFVGLDEFEGRPVFNLSGGQKQRVAIASVLAMEPGVVVFDEPTANLDPEGALEVQALIRELKEHEVTVMVIEHDVSRFVDMADRLVVLADGRIAYNGPPREILADHGLAMRDQIGLRIPQATEFALEARRKGYRLETLPLTIDDIQVESFRFQQLPTPPAERMAFPSTEREVIIEVKDLSFAYPGGPEVLKNITMDVCRGEILAIIGRNGSGKTTLTSLFIGLNKPASGSVMVCGMDVSQASIRELSEEVSYVFQYPEHQFITDSVLEEMLFGLKRQSLSPEEANRRAMEMLEMFQLHQVKDRHPFALSRGQKRRLSVASMLVLRPEVFILDEPTTGQDQRNVNQVMEFLQKLNQQGLTIILVTHDMELVAQYAHRVLVLDEGQVVFEGTPWQLFGEELIDRQHYGLIIPDIIELYRRVRNRYPNVAPVTSPRELAGLLIEEK